MDENQLIQMSLRTVEKSNKEVKQRSKPKDLKLTVRDKGSYVSICRVY